MKTILKTIPLLLILATSFFSCDEDYIDGMTYVEAGQDASSPTVTINYPLEGTEVTSLESITSIIIKYQVEDDIEISNIVVSLDGNEISNLTEFLDYRSVIVDDLEYDALATGEHVLTVSATDTDENTTTQSVNFEKVPPYTALYAYESLYMPFDGDFYEMISITEATEVGSPGFLGDAKVGINSYVPGTDNYITFPSEGLMSDEFSASFWYKVDASATRAGIITIGDDETDRLQGFRLFREGSSTEQRIKLNVGTGTGESWNDGGVIDVTAGEWVHIAFTISSTESIIYFNGQPVHTSTMSNGIDWTGCSSFTIGSGEDTFTYWSHLSDTSAIDDLRFFSTAISQQEIQEIVNSAYEPMYDGETFYMPFDGNYTELNSSIDATQVGSPTFAGESYNGADAYLGATDSYLTFPIDGLFGAEEFSAVFWYKVNPDPTRAGLLVVGDDADDRKQGFRLFREGDASSQRIKLNVGIGDGESWNDGGLIDATTGDWVQVAVTVSATESKIYFDGVLQNTATFSNAVDWTGCSDMVIGSGGDTFSYWGHASDVSEIDDLRVFNKALSESEIQAML